MAKTTVTDKNHVRHRVLRGGLQQAVNENVEILTWVSAPLTVISEGLISMMLAVPSAWAPVRLVLRPLLCSSRTPSGVMLLVCPIL